MFSDADSQHACDMWLLDREDRMEIRSLAQLIWSEAVIWATVQHELSAIEWAMGQRIPVRKACIADVEQLAAAAVKGGGG